MAETNSSNRIAINKQIDEYYKVAIEGMLATGNTYRDANMLAAKAMNQAIAIYKHRCEVLGQTFAKNIDV